MLQQKYNKTVQVQVTIIPRQPGKELSVQTGDCQCYYCGEMITYKVIQDHMKSAQELPMCNSKATRQGIICASEAIWINS